MIRHTEISLRQLKIKFKIYMFMFYMFWANVQLIQNLKTSISITQLSLVIPLLTVLCATCNEIHKTSNVLNVLHYFIEN